MNNRLPFLLLFMGIALHALLSEPLLLSLGLDYAGTAGGSLWAKIHPGSYLIIISFIILLFRGGNPLRSFVQLLHSLPAATQLILIYIVVGFFWVIRDPSGIGLLLDTHIIVPMAAIIVAMATPAQRQALAKSLIWFALLNASIGIFESLLRERLLPFPEGWEVSQEEYFRASSFLGHPLNNALFTGIALITSHGIIRTPICRALTAVILLGGLVAFGGRAAFAISLTLYILLIAYRIWKSRTSETPKPLHQHFLYMSSPLLILLAIGVVMTTLFLSPLGERLTAFSGLSDASAESRLAALRIFDYVETSDFWFGMSVSRLDEVRDAFFQNASMSDIENPWLLMLLMLGGVLFPLWLLGLLRFFYWILQNSSLACRLALLTYILVISTSNGFGRKDSVFVMTTTLIVALFHAQALTPARQSWLQNKTTPPPV